MPTSRLFRFSLLLVVSIVIAAVIAVIAARPHGGTECVSGGSGGHPECHQALRMDFDGDGRQDELNLIERGTGDDKVDLQLVLTSDVDQDASRADIVIIARSVLPVRLDAPFRDPVRLTGDSRWLLYVATSVGASSVGYVAVVVDEGDLQLLDRSDVLSSGLAVRHGSNVFCVQRAEGDPLVVQAEISAVGLTDRLLDVETVYEIIDGSLEPVRQRSAILVDETIDVAVPVGGCRPPETEAHTLPPRFPKDVEESATSFEAAWQAGDAYGMWKLSGAVAAYGHPVVEEALAAPAAQRFELRGCSEHSIAGETRDTRNCAFSSTDPKGWWLDLTMVFNDVEQGWMVIGMFGPDPMPIGGM